MSLFLSESNRWDRKVIKLAEKGFSAKLISYHTGLSTGQISYRLKNFDCRISDYRHGKGAYAIQQLRKLDRLLGTTTQLQNQIEAYRRLRKGKNMVRRK